jgi:predicted RNA-binding protein with TRAM domain
LPSSNSDGRRYGLQLFLRATPILNIWLKRQRTDIKVEIVTRFIIGSELNLEDSSGFEGGSDGRSYNRPRFDGPRPFKPSPVRVGEEYDVKIESLSKRGDSGVARVQGLVIFVAGTKVGDAVKVKIAKVGRGYATAELVGEGTDQPPASPEIDSEKAE